MDKFTGNLFLGNSDRPPYFWLFAFSIYYFCIYILTIIIVFIFNNLKVNIRGNNKDIVEEISKTIRKKDLCKI